MMKAEELMSQEQEWLKTTEQFGDLTDPANLTALASEGFSQLGRGCLCLSFRHGLPCSFYLPNSQLQFLLNASNEPEKLPYFLKTYQPDKGELLLLVTFDDIERQRTSSYRIFYLSLN